MTFWPTIEKAQHNVSIWSQNFSFVSCSTLQSVLGNSGMLWYMLAVCSVLEITRLPWTDIRFTDIHNVIFTTEDNSDTCFLTFVCTVPRLAPCSAAASAWGTQPSSSDSSTSDMVIIWLVQSHWSLNAFWEQTYPIGSHACPHHITLFLKKH